MKPKTRDSVLYFAFFAVIAVFLIALMYSDRPTSCGCNPCDCNPCECKTAK